MRRVDAGRWTFWTQECCAGMPLGTSALSRFGAPTLPSHPQRRPSPWGFQKTLLTTHSSFFIPFSSLFNSNSLCSFTVSHCFQCSCSNDAGLPLHLLSDIISLACSKPTFAWKVCTTTGHSTFGRPAETRSALATVADKGMVLQTSTYERCSTVVQDSPIEKSP